MLVQPILLTIMMIFIRLLHNEQSKRSIYYYNHLHLYLLLYHNINYLLFSISFSLDPGVLGLVLALFGAFVAT